MMATGPSLRATLSKYVPTWLANVPGLRNLFSIAWTFALFGDCLREIALEGQFAAYPGVGTPTANPLIGASRGLIQGPNESNALFAKRCIAFRAMWKTAGRAATLASNVQAYLVGTGNLGAGVYPVVMIVDRAGVAVTANADTSISEATITWDWDNLGGWVDGAGYHAPAEILGTVTGMPWWSDLWIVIEDPFTHYASFSDPAWLAAWNSGDQTIDSLCPQAVVQGLQVSIIEPLKGAHEYVRNVTWVPSVAGFTPTGYYGNSSRNVAGVQTPTRTIGNSYWTQEAA